MKKLIERVTKFYIENKNTDEYKDEKTGLTFYQDYVYGICLKTSKDYNDDDPYLIFYEDIYK